MRSKLVDGDEVTPKTLRAKDYLGMITMTTAQYHEHAEENAGYCKYCNEITEESGVEPDAHDYECPDCHKLGVLGIELALVLGKIEINDEHAQP